MAWGPLPRPGDFRCVVEDPLPWGTSGLWGHPSKCDSLRMLSSAQEVLRELWVSGNFLTVSHGGASLGPRSCAGLDSTFRK